MATGVKYNTKEALLDALTNRVKYNQSQSTKSEEIQGGLKDIVESLWDMIGGGGDSIYDVSRQIASTRIIGLPSASTVFWTALPGDVSTSVLELAGNNISLGGQFRAQSVFTGRVVMPDDFLFFPEYTGNNPKVLVYDGNTFNNNRVLQWIDSSVFSGVQSVTGIRVNNSDPLNPVVELPTKADIIVTRPLKTVNGESLEGPGDVLIPEETATSIKTKYESNANTNAYTDSEKTKLAGLEGSKFVGQFSSLSALQTAFPTASIGSYAYVDQGVGQSNVKYIWDDDDTSWVEQGGVSAEETPATIKAKYESNPDTNAFTDAEKTNLSNQSGVNTGDETAASIKSKYESNSNTNVYTDFEQAKLANQSNTNTGDETTASIKSKRPIRSINGNTLEALGDLELLKPYNNVFLDVFSSGGSYNANSWDRIVSATNGSVDIFLPVGTSDVSLYYFNTRINVFNISGTATIKTGLNTIDKLYPGDNVVYERVVINGNNFEWNRVGVARKSLQNGPTEAITSTADVTKDIRKAYTFQGSIGSNTTITLIDGAANASHVGKWFLFHRNKGNGAAATLNVKISLGISPFGPVINNLPEDSFLSFEIVEFIDPGNNNFTSVYYPVNIVRSDSL
jgi:hypothetical protein